MLRRWRLHHLSIVGDVHWSLQANPGLCKAVHPFLFSMCQIDFEGQTYFVSWSWRVPSMVSWAEHHPDISM